MAELAAHPGDRSVQGGDLLGGGVGGDEGVGGGRGGGEGQGGGGEQGDERGSGAWGHPRRSRAARRQPPRARMLTPARLVAWAGMSLASAVLGRLAHLPRPLTEDVVCEKNLRIPMDDGAVLLADRWVPRAARDVPQPTVLVRSPYGRRQAFGLIFGRTLAERGLQVIVQSVRGTFGSEGEFNPFDERADGLATLRLDPRPALARRADRAWSGRATSGSCSGPSRPRSATTSWRWRSRSPPPSFTARPTRAAASRWRPRCPGSCCSPRRRAGWRRCRSSARSRGCRSSSRSCRSATSTCAPPARR